MTTSRPDWLKVKIKNSNTVHEVQNILKKLTLHTVCEEANCPNAMECFSRRTATFMILGDQCTRNCTFCNVSRNSPGPVNEDEPHSVAKAVTELKLKHVVITSVTRDDLQDGGAGQFARVIEEIRSLDVNVVIEVLIPDFMGLSEALKRVIESKPRIINHNVETVPRLYPTVRPMAIYERSLTLLENVKRMDKNIYTKSGLMVGLGENEQELIEVMKDLRKVGCDLLTIGQYLAPSAKHHPVVEYIHPNIFEYYKGMADGMGFADVASAPLVRSSYFADHMLKS